MKTIFRVSALAAFVVSITAQAAQTYDYSYMFDTNQVISGSFTGTANGNLITDLSNITASLDGVAFNGSGMLRPASYTTPGQQCSTCFNWSSGAVASFDGRQSNFLFMDAYLSSNGALGHYTNYFYVIPWPNGNQVLATQAQTPVGIVDYYNGNYNPSNWHIVAAPVPEPESITLFGIGLIALLVVRKKSQK